MRQYTWHSRIELLENGTVKDTRIELVSYGPGGELQHKILNDQGARLPIGFLRAIIESEREKVETYLKGCRVSSSSTRSPARGRFSTSCSGHKSPGPTPAARCR
jgi:hypothetical protein